MKIQPRSAFYFNVTGWELQALRHLHRVVEDNLEEMLHRYSIPDERGRSPTSGPPPDLALMMIEARVPALFRNPVIAAGWSLYECCLVEVSEFFKSALSLRYSLVTGRDAIPSELRAKWSRWHMIQRANHFFKAELGIAAHPDTASQDALNLLRLLRNVIVHDGGRRGVTKPATWAQLEQAAGANEGLGIDTGYIVLSRPYVEEQLNLLSRVTGHLVQEARQLVERHGLDQ